jgi:hypothetical protein
MLKSNSRFSLNLKERKRKPSAALKRALMKSQMRIIMPRTVLKGSLRRSMISSQE